MYKRSDDNRMGCSQVVPDGFKFSGPCFKPPHAGKPQQTSNLAKVLVKLENFEYFSISIHRRWPWDENVNERRLVPAYLARCVVLLAIHDKIFEECGSMVKGQTVGEDCAIGAVVNRGRRKPKTDSVSE